jgi:hypothetical protein
MPVYNREAFRSPAPVALLTIRSPETGASVTNVPMLLDSGADISILPRGRIQSLIASPQQLPQFELVSFDGTRSVAPVVNLEMQFLTKLFRGQFPVVDGVYGILGRNVLNSVALMLDGPSLEWEEVR